MLTSLYWKYNANELQIHYPMQIIVQFLFHIFKYITIMFRRKIRFQDVNVTLSSMLKIRNVPIHEALWIYHSISIVKMGLFCYKSIIVLDLIVVFTRDDQL